MAKEDNIPDRESTRETVPPGTDPGTTGETSGAAEGTSSSVDTMELRSEEVQEILTRVPHWMISWGSTLFFILILLVLAISWFVKYPDIIPSEAYVTTEVPPQKEYARSTAKIQAIFVEDNQIVDENTPLAVLENTANYEDVFLLKALIDTLKVNSRSFTFPIDSLPVLFLGDIDADFASFENSYLQYTLNKELNPFANEALANKLSKAELQNRLSNLTGQQEIARSKFVLEQAKLERYKTLRDKEVISAQEYETIRMAYLQEEQNLKNLTVSISQLREAVSNANRTSRGTDINKTREEINLLKDVLQSFNRLKKSIRDWELMYLLKSDIAGKVSFMDIWNTNQTVTGGDLVFTIVPSENSSYVAKLKAPSRNSGKIVRGQTVNIKLENYPDDEYGVLKGHIESISLIPDTDGFYRVDVALPDTLITTYGKHIDFKQEMQGAAEIVTEDLRLIERFFYQLKDVLNR